MARRKYSDRERAEFVALVGSGVTLTEACGIKGIPDSTGSAWMRGRTAATCDDSKLVAQEKDNLADAIERVVWLLVRAVPGKIKKAGLGAVSTSIGIGIDKIRLLREQPTSIVSSSSANPAERVTNSVNMIEEWKRRKLLKAS